VFLVFVLFGLIGTTLHGKPTMDPTQHEKHLQLADAVEAMCGLHAMDWMAVSFRSLARFSLRGLEHAPRWPGSVPARSAQSRC